MTAQPDLVLLPAPLSAVLMVHNYYGAASVGDSAFMGNVTGPWSATIKALYVLVNNEISRSVTMCTTVKRVNIYCADSNIITYLFKKVLSYNE